MEIEKISGMRKMTVQLVAQIGVLITAGLHTLWEIVQLIMAPRSYFKSYENIIELSTCILSIIFVVDFNSCHEVTGVKYGWQWEIGALTITVAWINFLSNFRMYPILGIYVLMISNILKSFLNMGIVVLIFLLGFAIGFHSLLAEQVGSIFLHLTNSAA